MGILTTAEKQGKLLPQHARLAVDNMMKLNKVGTELAAVDGVTAITDVTGFGLLGHLLEICQGSELSAVVNLSQVPVLDSAVLDYLAQGCVPGGSGRNWESIGAHIEGTDSQSQTLLCDPQTSGGLLVAVRPEAADEVAQLLARAGCYAQPIGELVRADSAPMIKVNS